MVGLCRFSYYMTTSESECEKRGVETIVVGTNSRVAVITSVTGQAIFVHLACGIIGCSAVAVNGYSSVGAFYDY
nr:CBN-MEC-18 protein [Haemonchus contortus]